MEDLLTIKGLELDALSPGDIVTAMPRDPKAVNQSIYRVISSNASCVVVQRLNGPNWARKRELLQMSSYRWFDASELLHALDDGV